VHDVAVVISRPQSTQIAMAVEHAATGRPGAGVVYRVLPMDQ